jgi:hypothetical protein
MIPRGGEAIASPYVYADGDTVLEAGKQIVVVDASAGDVDITLPPIASTVGKPIYVRKIDSSSNVVRVIDGVSAFVLLWKWDTGAFISDRTSWSNVIHNDYITPEYIDVDSGLAAPAWKEGRVFYDSVNKTLAVYNDESDVTLQLGQEMYIRAKNNTASPILNGYLVFISGADGALPTIELARSDSPNTTGVIAMATHEIGVGQIGFTTTLGSVSDVNTNLWTAGTTLYLSETVDGGMQSTAPAAPNFPIQIGIVLHQGTSDGRIQVGIGPTDVAQTMVIQDLEINEDLRVDKKFTLNPSDVTDVTAVGGVTLTHGTMRVQGDGGPVIVTANPQIAPGTDGQIVFLHGNDDIKTLTFHDGDGLHLHSGSVLIMGQHDHLIFQWDDATAVWEEIATNFKSFDTSWSFSSPAGAAGVFYLTGFYLFGSTSFTPAGGTTLGTALTAYQAHAFLVLGDTSTDMVVRVSGTSVDEAGNRTESDFQDLDTSGGVLDDYFETTKKWVGQITYTLQSGTGVAVNVGLCKYWDNQNSDFRVTGFEVTGLAGATDTGVNFGIIRHRPVGWTFQAGDEPLPPPYVADMQTDFGVEHALVNNQPFAWKRIGLSEEIDHTNHEGLICEVTTTANKAIEILNWTFSIRPS